MEYHCPCLYWKINFSVTSTDLRPCLSTWWATELQNYTPTSNLLEKIPTSNGPKPKENCLNFTKNFISKVWELDQESSAWGHGTFPLSYCMKSFTYMAGRQTGSHISFYLSPSQQILWVFCFISTLKFIKHELRLKQMSARAKPVYSWCVLLHLAAPVTKHMILTLPLLECAVMMTWCHAVLYLSMSFREPNSARFSGKTKPSRLQEISLHIIQYPLIFMMSSHPAGSWPVKEMLKRSYQKISHHNYLNTSELSIFWIYPSLNHETWKERKL